jgi:hypothetical protein
VSSLEAGGFRTGGLLALAFLAPAVAAGEEPQAGPLVTDRPDFTESAVSVDPRRVQLEAGYTYEDAGDDEIDSIGELLLRIGLTRTLELRIAPVSYVRQLSRAGTGASGIEDPTVGIKWEIARGGEPPSILAPEAALIVSTTLPVGGSEVSADEPLPAAVLALAWETHGSLGVASNLGVSAESDGEDRYAVGLGSLALGLDLGGSWAGFLEYYGFLPEGPERSSTHFVDTGVTYLVSDDFQLDLRVGTEIGGETDSFAGVGLAYRW